MNIRMRVSKKVYKKIFSNFFAPALKGEVAENQGFRQLPDQGQNLIFSKSFTKTFLDSLLRGKQIDFQSI